MDARHEMQDDGLRAVIAGTLRHCQCRSLIGSWSNVLLLMVLMGSSVSASAGAAAQNVVKEWSSVDRAVRMITFWNPVQLRQRLDEWTNYVVVKTESGDTFSSAT